MNCWDCNHGVVDMVCEEFRCTCEFEDAPISVRYNCKKGEHEQTEENNNHS